MKNSDELILTPSRFYQFEKSPLWIWHDYFDDAAKKEPLSEFVLKIMEEGVLHEREYVKGLDLVEVEEKEPRKGLEITRRYMQEGRPLIYQGWLEARKNKTIYRGRPDLLEKCLGSSQFGDWFYVPVDIKSSSKIKKVYTQQLVFYCLLLEFFQGFRPQTAFIIDRHHVRRSVAIDEKAIALTQEAIDEIIAIMHGKKPPLLISSATRQSPWFKEDLKEAERSRDIALIYNLRKDVVQGLREVGVRTIEDMAMKSIRGKVRGASTDTLKRAQLQATALIDQRAIWIGEPGEIKEAPLKLYFDIEGDPSLNTEYLFGFWIVGDAEGKYAKRGNVRKFPEETKYFLYFLAETPEGEQQMWEEFLDWIELLPVDYVVYHYASYEKTALTNLSNEYEDSPSLKNFRNQMVDLRDIVKNSVILPLYFYSIKDIAKSRFVNFQWRHEKAGGSQSIFWYEQWLENGNRKILEEIIDYNEDDVRATEYVHLWLKQNRSGSTP